MTNQELKDMRVHLDAVASLTRELKALRFTSTDMLGSVTETMLFPSPQVLTAEEHIISARSWLGFLMGELGAVSPYKKMDGNRANAEDIEPATDKSYEVKWNDEYTHIQKVDQIRQRLEDLANKLKEWTEQLPSREASICRTNAWTHLVDARMQLGHELNRIREEHDAQNADNS